MARYLTNKEPIDQMSRQLGVSKCSGAHPPAPFTGAPVSFGFRGTAMETTMRRHMPSIEPLSPCCQLPLAPGIAAGVPVRWDRNSVGGSGFASRLLV
ncbi:hypothetical protein BN1723_001689 [Verticillium longisporum]|uniref:Uncharacterized protein n=1 Tax=Verticillium longisporum TaxID=100787 RepID=A0A0G4KQR5_VERLO|nr:hypothetical protein BN1723_001689 [Verticillium longisporum]CRK12148.1 hypothetical protein BN1708_010345 [Verticillium longisporum]